MKIIECRFCNSARLQSFLDLGFAPHSDGFLTRSQLDKEESYYPLKVVLCDNCGLSQLNYTVDPKKLYQENYIYDPSVNSAGVQHYNEFAKSIAKRFSLNKNDLVVDIGSNVGVLLLAFQKEGVKILGVDPAENMASIAIKSGVPTIMNFFIPRAAKIAREKYGPAKIIIGTNVFAHIYNHQMFMEALDILLSKDGIFIFESPHFINLVKNLEYDTIYHQHLLYLALKPVINFFGKHNMEIFDVETYPIHGGSFRVFISRKGLKKINPAVKQMLTQEEKENIYLLPKLKQFANDVDQHRLELMNLLRNLKAERKNIAIVSAPAKGMTLLNYCHIGPELIDFATEKSKLKTGRFTPGTHIPILDDEELLKRQPDYALLLAWNFAPQIMEKLKEYKRKGGKFIIPIPKPKIV